MAELTSQQLLSVGNNLKTLNKLANPRNEEPTMLDLPERIDYMNDEGLVIGFAVWNVDAEQWLFQPHLDT